MSLDTRDEGLAWQSGVWDRMSDVYVSEIDALFAPVIERVVARAGLAPGEHVLDLGAGTGSVALAAASRVGPEGTVLGLDISNDMLAHAEQRARAAGLDNVAFKHGGAEAIAASDAAFDVIIASLSMMYVIDRQAAARECARVLRADGRLVAAVWAGPDVCDIVRFQEIAGSLSPSPPVPGVGPGSLADTTPFLHQLAGAGIDAVVETESLTFTIPSFESAWNVLAGVTAASLTPQRAREAQAAVRAAMWPDADRPLTFRNLTQFIVCRRRA